MKKLALFVAMLPLPCAAQSVTGMPFTAPVGQVFHGPVAKFAICNGSNQQLTAIYALIDWGDNTGRTLAEIQRNPQQVLGAHTYATPNTYQVTVAITGTCVTGSPSSFIAAGFNFVGTATATVPPEVATKSISLSPATVTRGVTATATVQILAPAPAWGTLVQLGSSDTTTATVPPGALVQFNGTRAVVTVTTLAFTGAARNVTLTAVSGGVAVSAILRVR